MGAVVRAMLVFLAAGCSLAGPVASEPPPPASPESGVLSVYIQPLSRDASRLRFSVDEISAVRESGVALPLSVYIAHASVDVLSSSRRLASGSLPPGRYTGLAISVESATLESESGESSLLAPEGPVTIQVPFMVERNSGVVISVQLDYRESVAAGFRFTPDFSAGPPAKPAPDLIGAASSRGADQVTLFDKVTGQVVGLIPTSGRPSGLVLDRARRRAYVAASGDDTIEAVGLLEQAVLARLNLRSGDEPVEMALTPDGRTLVSANRGSSTVSVIDAVPLVERKRIPVGNEPGFVLMDPEGRRAWVFNTGSSSITVIDVAAQAVAGTVSTEAGPLRGQFNRAGDKLYIMYRSSPYLSIIDPLSLAVTGRIYVGAGATALKVDPRTDRIYLAIRGDDAVDIYDPLSLLPLDSIPTDGNVSFMAIDDEGRSLYLVLPGSDEVRVIEIVGKKTIARIDVGDDPYDVALMGER